MPASLPALTAAYRVTQKAAGVGFDWSHVDQVLDQVREELVEVEEARAESSQRLDEEVGDLLFAAVNLARHLEVDPEGALSRATRKFRKRFQAVEAAFESAGRDLGEASLEEMDQVWEEVKEREEVKDREASSDPV